MAFQRRTLNAGSTSTRQPSAAPKAPGRAEPVFSRDVSPRGSSGGGMWSPELFPSRPVALPDELLGALLLPSDSDDDASTSTTEAPRLGDVPQEGASPLARGWRGAERRPSSPANVEALGSCCTTASSSESPDATASQAAGREIRRDSRRKDNKGWCLAGVEMRGLLQRSAFKSDTTSTVQTDAALSLQSFDIPMEAETPAPMPQSRPTPQPLPQGSPTWC